VIVNVSVNGDQVEVAATCTIRQLLEQLQISTKYVAVEVNWDLIPQHDHAEHLLRDGDQLEVVTLVGGG